MNKHSPLSHSGSLLERAAELYGFGSAPAAAPAPPVELSQPSPDPAPRKRPGPSGAEELDPGLRRGANRFLPVVTEARAAVDRDSLRERGFIVPDSPAAPLAEEFRIV